MGGPGLLPVVGTASELPKVDLPNCPILVDVESFHQYMVRAVYNCKSNKPEEYVARGILNRFLNAADVEFFLDGHGNQEKYGTSMARRDKNSSLDDAESIVEKMEEKGELGQCISKVDYRTGTNLLKSSTPITYDFKERLADELVRQLKDRYDEDLRLFPRLHATLFPTEAEHGFTTDFAVKLQAKIENRFAPPDPTISEDQCQAILQTEIEDILKAQSLPASRFNLAKRRIEMIPKDRDPIEQGKLYVQHLFSKVHLVQGEADLAIVRRAKELLDEGITAFVVVGNDCDYAIHPSIPTLLRPSGKKYIQYKIDDLLAASGWTRAQYTALGCVSSTDYSANLPGLAIGKNSDIIKSFTESKFAPYIDCATGNELVCTPNYVADLVVSICHLENDVSEILRLYYENEKVIKALEDYRSSDHSASPKKVNRKASQRIFVEGEETPLSETQKDVKLLAETTVHTRVLELKARMLRAGKRRREVLKERKGETPST